MIVSYVVANVAAIFTSFVSATAGLQSLTGLQMLKFPDKSIQASLKGSFITGTAHIGQLDSQQVPSGTLELSFPYSYAYLSLGSRSEGNVSPKLALIASQNPHAYLVLPQVDSPNTTMRWDLHFLRLHGHLPLDRLLVGPPVSTSINWGVSNTSVRR